MLDFEQEIIVPSVVCSRSYSLFFSPDPIVGLVNPLPSRTLTAQLFVFATLGYLVFYITYKQISTYLQQWPSRQIDSCFPALRPPQLTPTFIASV